MKPVLAEVITPSERRVTRACRARTVAAGFPALATAGGVVTCFAVVNMVALLMLLMTALL